MSSLSSSASARTLQLPRTTNNISPLNKSPSVQARTSLPLPTVSTDFAAKRDAEHDANHVTLRHQLTKRLTTPEPLDSTDLAILATWTQTWGRDTRRLAISSVPGQPGLTTLTIGRAPASAEPTTSLGNEEPITASTATWAASSSVLSSSTAMPSSSDPASSGWRSSQTPTTEPAGADTIGSGGSTVGAASSAPFTSEPSTPPGSSQEPSLASTPSGLSTGGKIGIGIVLGIGLPWLCVFIWYLVLSRREKRQRRVTKVPRLQWPLANEAVRD